MKSRWFFFILSCVIIAVIVLSIFARTINSYFLEDDLGEVLYVHQIFSGHWDQLINNFTGNYMGISTMKVYRPCLLLSIMADYALWKTNATGYFITNISFLIASAIVLYMVLMELTRSWDRRKSALFAFFSAALFASSPLHCESVSLMVGRVDIICAFFYLLSLWSFICKGDSKNWLLTVLGIISFWVALLTKEMAIGLPIIFSAICFLFTSVLVKKSKQREIYSNDELKPTISRRLILTVKASYPLWLSTLVYFVIRYFALGTFFGGYVGGIGANQFSHIFEKWTDLGTIGRIIFPLNQSVFAGHEFYYKALLFIYCALAILIFVRLIIAGLPRTWLLLIVIWVITVLAPIYQLWGLGFNLEGARFLFFLTIPLSILLPLLIFAPTQAAGISSPISKFSAAELKILAPGILLLLALIFLDDAICAKNNIPWIHAGKQVRALLKEGQELAQRLSLVSESSAHKAIVLGIPKEINGAHIIYNGLTFNFLMAPPFAKDNYANQFITFDPILFGNANLINTARFRQIIASGDVAGCYVWQPEKMVFEQLALPVKIEEKFSAPVSLSFSKSIVLPYAEQRGTWEFRPESLFIQHCEKGAGIAIGPIAIDPFAYDFMEIEAAISPTINNNQMSVFWQNDYLNPEQNKNMAVALPLPLSNSGLVGNNSDEFKTYRFALSRYWRWFTNKQVQGLWLEFPPAQSISIKNIRLFNDQTIVPKLKLADLQEDNTGVYQLNTKEIKLQVDASQVADSGSVKLEISKANYFFDNFDNSEEAVMSDMVIDQAAKEFVLGSETFPTAGYYQLRAIALNKEGNPIGEWSDVLTVKL